MNASEQPALNPYDVLRMVRKFLIHEARNVDDIGTAAWLIQKINEQLGDTDAKGANNG